MSATKATLRSLRALVAAARAERESLPYGYYEEKGRSLLGNDPDGVAHRALGETLLAAPWGAVGNAFVADRAIGWDGARKRTLTIQGRPVAVARRLIDGTGTVRVNTPEEGEAERQLDLDIRQEHERAYALALAEGRRRVKALERAVETGGPWAREDRFDWCNGQMGGSISWGEDGCSAPGAGFVPSPEVMYDGGTGASEILRIEREEAREPL